MRDARWAPRATAVLVTVAVAGLAACTSPSEPPSEVTVTGEAGERPRLEYDRPLEVAEPVVEVVWAGEGPALAEGEPVLLHYYAESGTDGSLVGETWDREPKAWPLSVEHLGHDIHSALEGQHVGSRVLHVVPPGDEAPDPTVAVYDILPTRAVGEPVEPREGLPTVELAADGAPTITVPDTEPPDQLVVQPLVRGDGPQVAEGQVVTVQYTGVAWSTGEVFDSTWTQGKLPLPIPIGSGSVMQGWDTGLVEQTVGSQVLLVVPPHLGYAGREGDELAEETLVFVVDVLDASGGPER